LEIMMFKSSAPATEPASDVVASPLTESVPLSVLELDLVAPPLGWLIELDRRGIPIVLDDLGRSAVSRADARQLLDEKRENEARRREIAERQERQAIKQDRQRRAQLWTGAPAVEGVLAAALMLQASKDAQPRRTTPLQEALSGQSMTYHAYPATPEDES
jgi:hypothetical protein